MTQLDAHGVAVTLPTGWEGRVFRRPAAGEIAASEADGASAPPGETTHSVLHVATIPLPPGLGDYGSAAVPDLGPRDAFVMLVEFDPSDATSNLFATNSGVPRQLHADDFSPKVMQRSIAGQAGSQIFCNEAGRAFCLYVVIGSYRNREDLVRIANQVLATITISPLGARAAAPTTTTPTTTTSTPATTTTTSPAVPTTTTSPAAPTTSGPVDQPSTSPTAP